MRTTLSSGVLALLVTVPACTLEPGRATGFGSEHSGGSVASGGAPATGDGGESSDPASGPSSNGEASESGGGTSGTNDDGGESSTSGGAGSSEAEADAGPSSDESTTGGEPLGTVPEPAGVCSDGAPELYAEAQPAPELVVFGVYEPADAPITVTIDRQGVALVVVLSSYEAASWTLDLAAGVELQEVVLNGYEQQTVDGQGDALVTDRSGPNVHLASCAYSWPGEPGGCDTATLVVQAEATTGAALASFVGCYRGLSFSLQ